jgi:hypothetical protein
MNKYIVNTTDGLVTITDFHDGAIVAEFDKSRIHELTEDKVRIVDDYHSCGMQETVFDIKDGAKSVCVFINKSSDDGAQLPVIYP